MGKVSVVVQGLIAREKGLLEALRELQPLVLLASFSLVVGTFAASLSQTAAGYAIGASMGFLTGFSLLLLRRVFMALWKGKPEPDFVVLLAYGSIGVGLILLFLVPGEIASVIPTVQIYRVIATAAVYAVFGVWLADIFLTSSRQRQQRFPRANLIQPVYAVAAAGTLVSFGALAVDALFPLLSHSLTAYVLPTVGFVLMVGAAGGMEILVAKALRDERRGTRLQP